MNKINGKTQILAVIGDPIAHSLSPLMHNALIAKLNLDAVYIPINCPADNLSNLINSLREINFSGANLTIPHKEKAISLVDKLSPIAQFMGSINTIYWEDDKLCGTTTDPYGALTNLREEGVKWENKNIAILGNGGAARALAFALLSDEKSPIQSLKIFGRNPQNIADLCQDLQNANLNNQASLDYAPLNDFNKFSEDINLIINTTPVGMAPNLDQSPIKAEDIYPDQVVYDIVYNPLQTKLLQDAKSRGAQTVTGLGMLVHQGALSFKHWFPHAEPDIKTMFDQLSQI
ncbi:MAG: shikimate dehydrogenase [Fibrobacter sp.]|nr:shikimate dehydrogenase [Fibrobacter sp.]